MCDVGEAAAVALGEVVGQLELADLVEVAEGQFVNDSCELGDGLEADASIDTDSELLPRVDALGVRDRLGDTELVRSADMRGDALATALADKPVGAQAIPRNSVSAGATKSAAPASYVLVERV